MKLFLLLVLIATTIISCSSESGQRSKSKPETQKRIVQQLFRSSLGDFYSYAGVQSRELDTIYHIGDTLKILGEYIVVVR